MNWRNALQVMIGLLVLPVLINIGTGGTSPSWLTPLHAWLWPMVLACVALAVALGAWDRRGSIRRPNDPRNAELALKQVKRYVDARQRGSLGTRMQAELTLDERPGAVLQPAHLVRRVAGGDELRLSADLAIADIFGQMNESMLLLGAPGSGKTTQLLDLASELARQGGPAIPVMLDLADRFAPRRSVLGLFSGGGPLPLADWLVENIEQRYGIPQPIGRLWLAENRFTLLLDGLDEVPDGMRDRCVAEINGLVPRHGLTRMVVSSREADYDDLKSRLHLQGAVAIRPLDREAVRRCLAAAGPAAPMLEADEDLWSLLTTPLMLAIVVLARPSEADRAAPQEADPVARRSHFFDAYVTEALARRRSGKDMAPEDVLESLHALATIARTLDAGVSVPTPYTHEPSKILSGEIRALLSHWIGPVLALAACAGGGAAALRLNGWVGLTIALFGFCSLALLSFGEPSPPRIGRPWIFAVVILVCSGVPLALAAAMLVLFARSSPAAGATEAALIVLLPMLFLIVGTRRTPVRRVSRSRKSLGYQAILVVASTALAGGAYLARGLPQLVDSSMLASLTGACFMLGYIAFSAGTGDSTLSFKVPGAWIQMLGYLVVVVAALVALPGRWVMPSWEIAIGLLAGYFLAYVWGAFLLVMAVPLLFRMPMAIAGEPAPWRRPLLRYAVDRGLLTLTEGEYRFAHLLIRDHLAACDPAVLASAVDGRRATLGRI